MEFKPIDFGMVGRRPNGERVATVAQRPTRVGHAVRFSAEFIDCGSRLRGECRFYARVGRDGNIPAPSFAVGSQHFVQFFGRPWLNNEGVGCVKARQPPALRWWLGAEVRKWINHGAPWPWATESTIRGGPIVMVASKF